MSIRCKIQGHDRDECGICRRCKDATGATHAWKEAERERACFKRDVCERCGEVRENPDHDWEPGVNAIGDTALVCSRCNLEI